MRNHPHYTNEENIPFGYLIVGIIIASVIILMIIKSIDGCNNSTPNINHDIPVQAAHEESIADENERKIVAFSLGATLVQDMLKAPSTADFPHNGKDYVTKTEGDVYSVNSFVDAQNSFGAKIRTNWYCQLKFTGGKNDDLKNWVIIKYGLTER